MAMMDPGLDPQSRFERGASPLYDPQQIMDPQSREHTKEHMRENTREIPYRLGQLESGLAETRPSPLEPQTLHAELSAPLDLHLGPQTLHSELTDSAIAESSPASPSSTLYTFPGSPAYSPALLGDGHEPFMSSWSRSQSSGFFRFPTAPWNTKANWTPREKGRNWLYTGASLIILGVVGIATVLLVVNVMAANNRQPSENAAPEPSPAGVQPVASIPTKAQAPIAATPAPTFPNGRRGSFLVIGDWGWDSEVHGNAKQGCQQKIAAIMEKKFRELGDVKFIINVGDSFYPDGVKSKNDPQWDTKWRDIYSKEIRSVPWYSVYGNHDLYADPGTCGSFDDAAQGNADIDNLDYFYMPNYAWHKQHPELGLEVVAMDMNHFGWAGQPWTNAGECTDCSYSDCEDACKDNMKTRAEESYELFKTRHSATTEKNMLVFSHYPTDYFKTHPDFMAKLSDDSRAHISYFGGHRHAVDNTSTTSIAPNTNWLVGGGGGWSCDGAAWEPQGFVVGEISVDYKVETYPVLFDSPTCCVNMR